MGVFGGRRRWPKNNKISISYFDKQYLLNNTKSLQIFTHYLANLGGTVGTRPQGRSLKGPLKGLEKAVLKGLEALSSGL